MDLEGNLKKKGAGPDYVHTENMLVAYKYSQDTHEKAWHRVNF